MYLIWKDNKVHTVLSPAGVEEFYPVEQFTSGGFSGCYCLDTEEYSRYRYGRLNPAAPPIFITQELEDVPPEFRLALLLMGHEE